MRSWSTFVWVHSSPYHMPRTGALRRKNRPHRLLTALGQNPSPVARDVSRTGHSGGFQAAGQFQPSPSSIAVAHPGLKTSNSQ